MGGLLHMNWDAMMQEIRQEANDALPECDKLDLTGRNQCLCEFAGYKCTKPKGHDGGHVAHGALGQIIERW